MITPKQVLPGCYFRDAFGEVVVVADVFPTDDGEYAQVVCLPAVPYDEVTLDEHSVSEFCDQFVERVWPGWEAGNYKTDAVALPTQKVEDEDKERS